MENVFDQINSFLSSFEGVTFGGIEVVTLATWFAAGIVAGALFMARRPVGFLGDMVVGVLGGLLGGWVTQVTGFRLANLIDGMEDDHLRTFIGDFLTAVAGAIVVLILIRLVIPKKG